MCPRNYPTLTFVGAGRAGRASGTRSSAVEPDTPGMVVKWITHRLPVELLARAAKLLPSSMKALRLMAAVSTLGGALSWP